MDDLEVPPFQETSIWFPHKKHDEYTLCQKMAWFIPHLQAPGTNKPWKLVGNQRHDLHFEPYTLKIDVVQNRRGNLILGRFASKFPCCLPHFWSNSDN